MFPGMYQIKQQNFIQPSTPYNFKHRVKDKQKTVYDNIHKNFGLFEVQQRQRKVQPRVVGIYRPVYIFAGNLIILLKYFATKLNECHDNEHVA